MRRTQLRQFLITVFAIGVVTTACSNSLSLEESAQLAEARAEIAEQLDAKPATPPDVTEWSNSSLPLPFSPLTSAGGNVVYRTVEDEQLYLVAISAASGSEQWRRKIDPLGQLRGTAPPPLVIPELALVIETQSGTFRHKLTAFDATGEELWSETLDVDAVPAFRCGSDVCARYGNTLTKYNALTGNTTTFDGVSPLNTIFTTTQSYVFGAGPRTDDATVDWVGLSDAETGEELWTITRATLDEHSGAQGNPNFGWGATIFEDEGVITVFLGSENPGYAGVQTGLDLSTGEVLWTIVDETACIFSDYSPDAVILCTSDEDSQSISRIDVTTGTPLWTHPIGGADDFIWTDAVGDFVLVEGTDGYLVLDITTGSQMPSRDVQLCGFNQPWQDIDVFWSDEPVTYRAASHPALCNSDLEAITAAEAVEAGDPLSDATLLRLDNGWSISVGIDGSLSGTYTGG